MARLSGMPSEHHHEGPGDAPRRKRGRPGKNQASSQEVASVGGKRTADEAELSQTKRSKRVQVDNDEDQLAEEMEESFSRSQNGNSEIIRVGTSTSTTTRRNSRRHSEPPAAAQDDNDDDDDELNMDQPSSTQPAQSSRSGLTLDRVGAVRRDVATTRRARLSMPAQLHIERVDEEDGDNRIQYAPLTAVLDSRTRRRLRRSHLPQVVNEFEEQQKQQKQTKKQMLELRNQLNANDKTIKDLEFTLESIRLGNITTSAEHEQQLERELEQARDEIHELRVSSLYNGSEREMSAFDGAVDMDDDEEEHSQFIEPADLKIARTIDIEYIPDTKYTTRVQELSSQMTFEALPQLSQLTHDTLMEDEDVLPDKIHDQAVERYERELQHYTQLLAHSQGALRIVTLELQNLHFLEAGATSDEIIKELRHSFDTLRVQVEKFFPGTTADLTSSQLLHKVPELFGGLFFELNQKHTLVTSSQKTELLLRRQYEGVLDLLGESDERVKTLEQDTYNLDHSNEEKQRTINDLEERVTTLTTLTNDQEVDITEKNTRINGLNGEIEEKDINLERLREALEKYRQDLKTVTITATTFETEHHALIKRMQDEHTEVINSLRMDLDNEQDLREAAEGDAQQKGEIIDDLEGRIERMEAEILGITEDMTELRERLAEQTEGRELAEQQRDDQAELANEYANEIDEHRLTITNLETQVLEFKTNLAAEREQREQTEAALDKANEDIEELNDRIHNLGIQANELRSKLFQLQQEKEAALVQLQEEAKEREIALNDQLVAETKLRKTAEKTVAKANKQIAQLQADLETANINLINMEEARQLLEKDREEQVVNLNQQLTDLENKYRALETSTSSTITSLQANITDLNNQVHLQQAEIKRLSEENVAKDLLYEQDTTALNEEILELKTDLYGERATNDKNQKAIASLERRVEEEANELLNMTDSHSAEVSSLKTVISTHESTIKTLQEQSAQRTAEHDELLLERTREIEELELRGTASVETITLLHIQIKDLKEQFAKLEEDTRLAVDALNANNRRLMDDNEQKSAALKKRNADALKAVQSLKTANVVVKSRNVDLGKVQTGKIIKTTEKVKVGKKSRKVQPQRNWRDSGIYEESSAGAEEDAEIPADFLDA